MAGKPKPLTTAELDRLVAQVMNPAYKVLLKYGLEPRIRWEGVNRIRRCYSPGRRDECAGVVMEEMETLIGRLAMVLFTEEKLERQQEILARWFRQPGWPGGKVLLASLEEMALDCAGWEWWVLSI